MTQCPMCAAAWRPDHALCECGYNAREVVALERELAMWKRRRSITLTAGITAFVLSAIVSSVPSLGALLGVTVLAFGAAMVAFTWCRFHIRVTNREIRAATTATALPEARIV